LAGGCFQSNLSPHCDYFTDDRNNSGIGGKPLRSVGKLRSIA
jgi:hypothetical protein